MPDRDPHADAHCRFEVAVLDAPVRVVELDWPASCGGEAIFVGRTRAQTHPEHGPLRLLRYEAYEAMALKRMRTLVEAAAVKHDCRMIRMVHARGDVGIGEASVVIQVAAPHRAQAFAACRWLIDQLKVDVPIWKAEVWADGTTWVEG